MYGDHAVSCGYGGERIAKHNHVRDALHQSGMQAHLGAQKEPDGLLPGSDDRPADILLPLWTNGKDTALDVTVVNPMRADLVERGAREAGAAVQHAFTAKMAKYDERCAREGIVFLPLAADTFGGWHEVAIEVFKRMGQQVARQVGREEEEAIRQLRQRLGILLMRDNVAMLASRAPTLPPAEVDGDNDSVD